MCTCACVRACVLLVNVCVCVCVKKKSTMTDTSFVIVCKQLPGNQSFISKYLPTRRVVMSGGWGNGSGPATAYKFGT